MKSKRTNREFVAFKLTTSDSALRLTSQHMVARFSRQTNSTGSSYSGMVITGGQPLCPSSLKSSSNTRGCGGTCEVFLCHQLVQWMLLL